jgi:hypothetical protein
MVLSSPAPIATAPLRMTELPTPEPGGYADALYRLRHDQIAGAAVLRVR